MRNYRQENKAELIRIKNARGGRTIGLKEPEDPVKRKRRIIIRAVGCAVALIAAVIAFSTFAKQCTHLEAGWQSVSADADADALLYASGITLNYDFEGTSNEIRVAMNELRAAYSKSLAHVYKLLDPVNAYDGYVNLAYINKHPDTDVKVSPELYSVLQSALELTEAGEANIFGGALYQEWKSITVLNDSAEADPLADDNERERIEELAEATARLSHFGLELKADNTVRFTVSEEYRQLLKRLETEAPVLDLGYLREAYELDYAAEEIEKAGFKKGFLTTLGGMTRCLSEAEGGFIVAYAPVGKAISDVFKVPMTGGLMCCTFRTYCYGEDDIEYYTVETAEGSRLRHPHYSLDTGEVNDALLTVMVSAHEGGFAELCAKSRAMITAASVDEAEALLKKLGDGMHAAFVASGDPNTVVADAGFEELVVSDKMSLVTK